MWRPPTLPWTPPRHLRGYAQLDGFVNDGADIVYRRAPTMSAAFVATPFDALEAELFHPVGKSRDAGPCAFTLESAMECIETKCAGAPIASETQTRNASVEPTGRPALAHPVGYLQVNPQFVCPSEMQPEVIFYTLKQAMQTYVEEYQSFQDWRLQAIALVNAEEVHFTIQMHSLADDTIRVDFTLQSGDELPFMEIVDKIRKDCRSIDKETLALPDLSFDLFDTWSSSDELFPGSLKTTEADLREVLDDIRAPHAHPFMVFEAAKLLKNYCLDTTNRHLLRTKLYGDFVDTLQQMLQGDDEDVSRFGIYALLLFAEDPTGLDVRALETAMTRSFQKGTTQKLASELQSAISGSCIRKKLTA